jgi:hypothetical protein
MKVPPPGGRVRFQPHHQRLPTTSGLSPGRSAVPFPGKKRRHEHFCSWREASDATCVSTDPAAENLSSGLLHSHSIDEAYMSWVAKSTSIHIFLSAIYFFSPNALYHRKLFIKSHLYPILKRDLFTLPPEAFTILFAIVTHYRNQHPNSSRTAASGRVAL